MTTGITSAALLGFYQAQTAVSTGGRSLTGGSGAAASTASGSSASSQPTPPWASTAKSAQVSASVQSALSGQALFNPSATKVSGANVTANYRNLFTLYQGLATLQDVANQAAGANETSAQIQALNTAFQSGLSQLQTYLQSSPFKGFSIAAGGVSTFDQSSGGVAAQTDTYTTGTLTAGSASAPLSTLSGNIQFSLTATLPSGKATTVNFNLADMGSEPRSLSNVVSYLNSQLAAAGVYTRFAVKLTQGAAQTTKVNGQTYTLPAGPDTFSLQLVGNSAEQVTLSAPDASPAVYITQSVGTTAGTTPDAQQQLVKLDASAAAAAVTTPSGAQAPAFTDTLAKAETSAIATATASDGSVYVLANVNGSTPAGQQGGAQPISGSQDVALLKYDSAGNLMSSHVIGATGSASGLGLAVSADGGEIAVTGTGTGIQGLNGSVAASGSAQGFVSVFSSSGQPLWTQLTGSGQPGQASQVAFGSDGSVYVAGVVTPSGGAGQNVLTGFSATGTQVFTENLGATSAVSIAGLATDGASLVIASNQNGDGVVQSYALTAGSAPSLAATRDLGALGSGSIAGIGVNADGTIMVGGSTTNGALNAGTVTAAYASGQEGFVAQLSGDLQPAASDSVAYYGASGDVRVTGMAVSGGQAYLTGQVVSSSSGSLTTDGFAAQIDPSTGVVGWSDTYSGLDNAVRPSSIAVGPSGSPSLEALGLPSGPMNLTPSQTLVANTSIKAGDRFTLQTNAMAQPVTITVAATDTLQTIADEINRISGNQASAKVLTLNGLQQLEVKPTAAGIKVTLGDGPVGSDALSGLGLKAVTLTTDASAKAASAKGANATTALNANYALNLPTSLSLLSSADISAAQSALKAAISTVRIIYGSMAGPAPATTSSGGAAPAYLTSEISSYQYALARLTAGSSGSTV